MTAPDRIWIDEWIAHDAGDKDDKFMGDVEYIRADLVPQWQPIETAPKYEGNGHPWILVYNGMAEIVELKLSDGDWWRNMGSNCPPTHWQPLPSPPPAT